MARSTSTVDAASKATALDGTDRRILSVLQQEGRLSNQDIAARANVSPAACWRRIRAMEDSGVIRGYRAELDRGMLSLGLCVFVHVSLSRHEPRTVGDFEKAVIARPDVLSCYATTGDSDFLLKVVTHDIRAYDRFLEEFLFTLPGIAQVRSSITLRQVKESIELPLT